MSEAGTAKGIGSRPASTETSTLTTFPIRPPRSRRVRGLESSPQVSNKALAQETRATARQGEEAKITLELHPQHISAVQF